MNVKQLETKQNWQVPEATGSEPKKRFSDDFFKMQFHI